MGAIAALVLVVTTVRTLWAADAARAAWSSTVSVIVATRDLRVGTVLAPRDLQVVGLPDAIVPAGAATGEPEALLGSTVTRPILAGEAVATSRLGTAGLGPTAALLPAGWRAVGVPRSVASPPLAPGDRVEIVTVAGGPGTTAATRVVSTGAEVLVVDDDTITVAVPANEVTAVVGAAAQGLVATVLVGS